MFDTLVRGGRIVDGTGASWFKADIAINGDTLTVLRGNTSAVQAAITIDASGLVVAPGFIDVHTHSDLLALTGRHPGVICKLQQGVCTEVIGLDGLSYAPASRRNIEQLRLQWAAVDGDPDTSYSWRSVAQYLSQFNGRTPVNVAYLVPHGNVRAEVMGWDDRPATKDEIRHMQDAIKTGIEQGAFGLSTGLTYSPCLFANTQELIDLNSVVAECGGVFSIHVRYDLGDCFLDPLREAIDIAKASRVRLHISHLMTNTEFQRGRTGELLGLLESARADGCEVTFDCDPHMEFSTALWALLPRWVKDGGPEQLLKKIRLPENRALIRAELEQMGFIPLISDAFRVGGVRTALNRNLEGQLLGAVAKLRGKDMINTLCDLLIEENLQISFVAFTLNEEDNVALIKHPLGMVASDSIWTTGEKPMRRNFGTFPRVLGEYVRERKAMALEEAVRKITSFPARTLGINDRGMIRSEMKADLVIFNPDTVKEMATIDNPAPPEGIEYVLINGKVVIEKGKYTGALPGRALTQRW